MGLLACTRITAVHDLAVIDGNRDGSECQAGAATGGRTLMHDGAELGIRYT